MKYIVWYSLILSTSICSASSGGSFFEWLGFTTPTTQHRAIQSYQQKDYQASLDQFHDLMNRDPYNPEYNYNVGTILYRQKKYNDAQQAFARVVAHEDAISKLKEQAYFNCGNSYYQLARWQQAIDAYRQALDINADNQSAHHNLQLALQKLQEEQIKNQQENKQQSQDNNKNQERNQDQASPQDGSQQEGQGDQQQQSAGNDRQQNNQGQGQKNQGKPEQKPGSDEHDGGRDEQDPRNGQQQDQQRNGQQQQKKQGQEQGDQQNGSSQDNGNEDTQDSYDMNESGQEKSDQENSSRSPLQDSGTDEQQDSTEQDFAHTQGVKEEMQAEQQDHDQQADATSHAYDKKEKGGSFKKPELKNELQDLYESKACQDERLTEYHASVMKTLEEFEERVQKHIIKNKVALQGSEQHGKRNW